MSTELKHLDDLENELQAKVAILQKQILAVKQTRDLLRAMGGKGTQAPQPSLVPTIDPLKTANRSVGDAIKEVLPEAKAKFTSPDILRLLKTRGYSFPRSSVRAAMNRLTDLIEIAKAGKGGRAAIYRRVGGQTQPS